MSYIGGLFSGGSKFDRELPVCVSVFLSNYFILLVCFLGVKVLSESPCLCVCLSACLCVCSVSVPVPVRLPVCLAACLADRIALVATYLQRRANTAYQYLHERKYM